MVNTFIDPLLRKGNAIVVDTIIDKHHHSRYFCVMISFTTTLQRFDKKGEKSGWTFVEINAAQASKLKPKTKVSYRVKGTLDSHPINKVALLPMGNGNFIIPFNAAMRKATGKRAGEKIKVVLEVDERKFTLSPDLMACLNDEPPALAHFKTLPGSHQRYFSKWVDSAKTPSTKAKRILMAVVALSRKLGFAEMLRENKRPG